MKKSLGILIWLALISTTVLSQSRGFVSYSVQDGLAQSNVVDIAEDQFGNLWLATFGGLSKFNGVDFTTYKKQNGLVSNRISCITIDTNGHIWTGSNFGVSMFDGSQFRNFSEIELSENQYVDHIVSDGQGRVWFSTTSGGVSVLLQNGELTSFKDSPGAPVGMVSGLVVTKDVIWITTYQNGIYRYQNEFFEKIHLPDLKDVKVTTIFADHLDNIWLGTSKGLYHLEGDNLQFMHSFHNESPDFSIFSLNQESEGAIWVGTTNGAFRFQHGACTPISASDGLTDNIIYKIHSDREGTLWFGSFGGGLYKSLGETFTHVGKNHGINHDYISSISKALKGGYWFGSYGGGIYHFTPSSQPGTGNTVINLSHMDGLSNDFVYGIITDDDENLWVATTFGLNRLRNGKFEKYYEQSGLPSNEIFSLLKCGDGSIYCGTSMGLTQIVQNNGVQFKNYTYDGIAPNNRVRSLVELKDGRILLGTQGGLKVFDGDYIKDYFEDDSLKHWPVSTMYEDNNGGVWCALVDDGILYHNPATNKIIRYVEENGLSSNIIYSLAMDQFGFLWVGTPHGLDKLSFEVSGEIKQVRSFAASDGFFGIETNTNAIYSENDGSIWFGTVSGAFKCIPKNDKLNTLEPITYITGIRLFSEHVDWEKLGKKARGWLNVPDNLILSHTQNHLTFEFFGNSLRNPERVSYQYTLENFDRNWQPVSNKSEAVYTNLPPGKYLFKVKASNNDNVWNQQPASIAFEITPPFWRTWWFFAVAVLIFGVLGRLYYNFRVQQKLRSLIQVEKIKNQETVKVRKRVAEDFHDQVGNQLASITVLVQLIQAKLSIDNQEVDELLQKLGQFTKTLFTGTRDFIWSIDPKSDKVNEMLIYIKDFGEELFEYSGINFYVDTNDAFETNVKLPVGWSRHVVFIIKEAMTNSLKHAKCKNVHMNFNVIDGKFVFEFKDDGVGLNGHHDKVYLGMGLQNMKERARKIGSEIVISSENGKGTIIVLKGKIPHNE